MSTGPSKLLMGLEPLRAAAEYGMGWLLNSPLQSIVQPGDGHSVIVFPGLGTGDGTTQYLRNFLNSIGYDAHGWGMGRNYGPRKGMEVMMLDIEELVFSTYLQAGQKPVTLIGWSLGGIYAREIAKLQPDLVRQVITLGTPFKATGGGTNAAALYEVLSGDTSHKDPNVIASIAIPPPVPFTSIYSKSDGIVHWECSIEDDTPITENIEIVGASHLGLGHNPVATYLIADRLTKTKDTWVKYTK